MTMKMIKSTSKISIIGVMLIYGVASLVLAPPPIAILFYLLFENTRTLPLPVNTNSTKSLISALFIARLQFIGHQPDLVVTGVADEVDDVHNLTVRHADPRPDVDCLGFIRPAQFHSSFDGFDQILLRNRIAIDVVGSCKRD